jgi:long-subunit fatty acid transport protein
MGSLLIIFLTGFVSGSFAQPERVIGNFSGVGVRAMGMGGAYIAVADDFTASYWNPAGLAQITDRKLDVSFSRKSHHNKSVFNQTQDDLEISNTGFTAMGFVYPYPVYQGSLVFAIGFNQVVDFDWGLRQTGFDKINSLQARHHFQHEGQLTLSSISAAVDVSPFISLGGTLGLVGGDDQHRNEFFYVDINDDYTYKNLRSEDTFLDEYQGARSLRLGALVRMPRENPRFRIGATVASSIGQEIRYHFRGNPEGYTSVEYDNEDIQTLDKISLRGRYEIKLPLRYAIGLSYFPFQDLLFSTGVSISEWSQSEYVCCDEQQQSLRAETEFDRHYRDVVRYHFGVEWRVPTIALDLRAGYYTDPLPFIGPYGSSDPPIEMKSERRFVTLGAGLLLDEVVQLDIGWIRGTFEQVEQLMDSGITNVLGQDTLITRVFISLGYSF